MTEPVLTPVEVPTMAWPERLAWSFFVVVVLFVVLPAVVHADATSSAKTVLATVCARDETAAGAVTEWNDALRDYGAVLAESCDGRPDLYVWTTQDLAYLHEMCAYADALRGCFDGRIAAGVNNRALIHEIGHYLLGPEHTGGVRYFEGGVEIICTGSVMDLLNCPAERVSPRDAERSVERAKS